MHFPCMEYQQHISVRRETRITLTMISYTKKWKNNPTTHKLKPTKNHTTTTVASVPFTHKDDPSVTPIPILKTLAVLNTRVSHQTDSNIDMLLSIMI